MSSAEGQPAQADELRLSPEALEAVTHNAARWRYMPGEMILWADEGMSSSLLFLAGSARVYRLSAEGKKITLREVQAGEVMPVVSGRSYVEATRTPVR